MNLDSEQTRTASSTGRGSPVPSTPRTLAEEHIKAIVVALGFFCGMISIILFVSIQLNKKLLQRLGRVNSVIQVLSFTLALIAFALLLTVEMNINFDGVNASSVIVNQIPWRFHEKYLALAIFLLLTAVSGFVASFYEVHVLISVDSMLGLVGMATALILVVMTGITSHNIQNLIAPATSALSGSIEHQHSSTLGSRCAFVLPQFSQEQLMGHGCPSKYSTTSENLDALKCKRVEIARVWEENRHILAQDQKDMYGCLNLSCCEQVNQIIQTRFDMVTVLGIFLILYLLVFIMNL